MKIMMVVRLKTARGAEDFILIEFDDSFVRADVYIISSGGSRDKYFEG